jgi:hypothetical protein
MSAFLTALKVEMVTCNSLNKPLKNPDGRQLWELIAPLGYRSDVLGREIWVPAGFITDYASVPRLPFFYRELEGIANTPGVVHDYIYSNGCASRDQADLLLKEACLLIGISPWKVYAIYAGVRLGGESHYMSSK